MPGRVVSFWMQDQLIEALDNAATEAGVPRNRWVTERLREAASDVDRRLADLPADRI